MASELGATLEDTLLIEEKKYIKITGVEPNTTLLRTHAQVLAIEHELKRKSFVVPNDTYYASDQYAPQLTGLESV